MQLIKGTKKQLKNIAKRLLTQYDDVIKIYRLDTLLYEIPNEHNEVVYNCLIDIENIIIQNSLDQIQINTYKEYILVSTKNNSITINL